MSLRSFTATVFQIPIVAIALALLAGCAEHPPTPVAQPPEKSLATLVQIKRIDNYCLAVGTRGSEAPNYSRVVELAMCNDRDPAQQWQYNEDKELLSEITDPNGERLMLYGMDIVGGRSSVSARSRPSTMWPQYRWEHDAQRNRLTTQNPSHAGLALTVFGAGGAWLDPWVSGRVTQNFTIAPIQQPVAPWVQIKQSNDHCLAVGELDATQSLATRRVGLVTCNATDPAQQWRHTADNEIISAVADGKGGALLLEGENIEVGRGAVWARPRASKAQAYQHWTYNSRRKGLFPQGPGTADKALTAFLDDLGMSWLDPWNGTPMQRFTLDPVSP
ncbi:RICIN domain-containing protein [Pseudomonas sp. B21-032]|uniref:RICIN domain-containing protein n=1 Tax=Pseudomonas sp. B21-032 TaxID=2895483 RepID=UPI002160E48E|nr:RICIN domain-containing protein [Pseudomonas sp. B21-032]UVL59662.1 RICIN domain-containing protein [Pseudomonas sp. B21-032]